MNKLILFLLILTTSLAYSQNSNIRGFVYEKSSGEPVMFCNVILKGTTIGSSTDINGRRDCEGNINIFIIIVIPQTASTALFLETKII